MDERRDDERGNTDPAAPDRDGTAAGAARPGAPTAKGGDAPTADQLRADIDSGRTHDKVAKSDPAAAPLGSDAEAGGNPPSAQEVSTARRHETGRKVGEKSSAAKPSASRVATQTTDRSGWWFAGVIAAIILVAIILAFIF